LNYRIIVNFAKARLCEEETTLCPAEQEKYNWTRDVVKFDERGLRGFLSRAIAALTTFELLVDTISLVRATLDRISKLVVHRVSIVSKESERNGGANAPTSSSDAPRSDETFLSTPTQKESTCSSNENKDLYELYVR
jgi:hypothetical protein